MQDIDALVLNVAIFVVLVMGGCVADRAPPGYCFKMMA